jgi:hypothetical protein
MEIDSSLRELRLFKGQGAWRFFMAWCLVFARICVGPIATLTAALGLLWFAPGLWHRASDLLTIVVRAIKQLN